MRPSFTPEKSPRAVFPRFRHVYPLLIILILSGCVPNNQAKGDSPIALSNQRPVAGQLAKEKTKQGRVTRVLSFGDFMVNALWNDPSVLKENGEYVMYATANIGGKWGKVLPFRGTSSDGINWIMDTRPLLQPGKKGTFDEDSVETPSVVKFKGKYHMFYSGVVRGFLKQELAIGHAVSDDGINWTKVSDRPLLAPTGKPNQDWNGYHVAEPGAVVFKDKLFLYFHASGLREGGQKPANQSSIGVVTSEDGFNFSKMRKVLTQGPMYPTTAPKQYSGYSTPSAVVADGKVHLFYDVVATEPSWEQVALHHAVSSDGIHFEEDQESLLRRKHLSWAKTEIRAPSALYENGEFKVWFAAHDKKQLQASGIGFMKLRP